RPIDPPRALSLLRRARFQACIIVHVWRVSWDFEAPSAAPVESYFRRPLRTTNRAIHATVATSGLPCCRQELKAFKRLLFRRYAGAADARIDWQDALA